MTRMRVAMVLALAALATAGGAAQPRTARDLAAGLAAPDPVSRARAACALRDLGDGAFEALQPLVAVLADAATVEADVCSAGSWRGSANDVTTPGELAAGALDDRRAVANLTETLKDREAGVRRQAAWALGAIGDSRAVPGLLPALKDGDAGVRKQAAWAIGVLGR